MAKKYKTSKNKAEILSLQLIENKANRLPSPPSIFINGKLTNICPVCRKPCSNFPWSCLDPNCGWAAVSNPINCCTAIKDVLESDEAEPTFAYELDDTTDYDDSTILTQEEKDLFNQAKNDCVDDLPHPPIWASNKER